jgi:hypothetical protein
MQNFDGRGALNFPAFGKGVIRRALCLTWVEDSV